MSGKTTQGSGLTASRKQSHAESVFAEDFSPQLEELLEKHGPMIYSSLRHPMNCEEASRAWGQLLSEKTDSEITYVYGWYLGALDQESRNWVDEGNTPPSSCDHVWLEVDGEIFDPTAAQFAPRSGTWLPEDYIEEQKTPIDQLLSH